MQIIGSLILGMIITILAVTLMILYVVVLVIGIGWLGPENRESQKPLDTKRTCKLAIAVASLIAAPHG